MSQPRILIVEDEPAIAELLALNLRHNGLCPLWAADGEAAQREMDTAVPDAILLDWMLPGMSGLQLARRWRLAPRTRKVPIIMLSARMHEHEKVAGLEAGADDYITKPFAMQELIARVRAVLRRHAQASGEPPLAAGALVLQPASRRVSWKGPALRLGPAEFRLLHFLMAHPQRVHSRRQLMEQLWGAHVRVEERTVDVQVKRLRAALGPAGACVETVRGVGYRIAVQPAAGAEERSPEAPRHRWPGEGLPQQG